MTVFPPLDRTLRSVRKNRRIKSGCSSMLCFRIFPTPISFPQSRLLQQNSYNMPSAAEIKQRIEEAREKARILQEQAEQEMAELVQAERQAEEEEKRRVEEEAEKKRVEEEARKVAEETRRQEEAAEAELVKKKLAEYEKKLVEMSEPEKAELHAQMDDAVKKRVAEAKKQAGVPEIDGSGIAGSSVEAVETIPPCRNCSNKKLPCMRK
jgi:hypothetical protein